MNETCFAVIPARMGSERVKCKNLRLISGKPMIYYAIEAAKRSECFDRIFVNSEDHRIGEVAVRYGAEFYQRPKELAASHSLIDEYIYEFLRHETCDTLAVVNPTSPFLSPQDIRGAVEHFREKDYDTLLSCENIRTHCFLEGNPINFSTGGKHPRSQDIPPIQALNFAVTMWRSKSFCDQYERKGHAVYTGKLGFHEFSGLAAIDVDWEEDFLLAELLMDHRDRLQNRTPRYDEVLQDAITS